MATIGRLVVALAANSAQLVQDLNKARKVHGTWANQVERRAKQTAKVIGGIGVAAAAAFAAAGVAGLVMINRQAAAIDKMAKTASNLRMDVSSFQRLSYVAEQSGNSVGELTGALQRMNQTLARPTAATQEALAGIGLSVNQLMQMNPEERFRAIAQAINNTGDEAKATAAQIAIFGRAGGNMLNLLQADFEGLNAEFDKMGIAITQRQAAMVAAYQDAKGRLGTLINGFKMQFTAQMAGPMSQIVNFINEASEKMGGMDKLAAAAAASMIRGIAGVIQAVASLVESLDDVLMRFKQIELYKLQAQKQSETMNAPSTSAAGAIQNIFRGLRGLAGQEASPSRDQQIRQVMQELEDIASRGNSRQGAVDQLMQLSERLLSGVGDEFEQVESDLKEFGNEVNNATNTLKGLADNSAWDKIFGSEAGPENQRKISDQFARDSRSALTAIMSGSEKDIERAMARLQQQIDAVTGKGNGITFGAERTADVMGMKSVFERLQGMIGGESENPSDAVANGIDSSGIISEIIEGRRVFHDGLSSLQQVIEKQQENEKVKVELNLTTDRGQLKGEIIASRELASAMQQIAAREINNTARGVAA